MPSPTTHHLLAMSTMARESGAPLMPAVVLSAMKAPLVVICTGACLLALLGCGPRNYHECVTQSLKGVDNDVAARVILASCAQRFASRSRSAALPTEALQLLTGSGQVTDGMFRGSLYNGNREWTVTRVTFRLEPFSHLKKQFRGAVVARDYNADVSLPPLTSSGFSFAVYDPLGRYSWEIVGAQGLPSQ